MIEFKKQKDSVILQYSPDNQNWVYEKLNDIGWIRLKKTFLLKKEHLSKSIEETEDFSDEFVEFKIADKTDDYYKFNKEILSIDYDLYIHKDIKLSIKTFTAEKNVSIFSRINELKMKEIYIGGNNKNSIPKKEFENLLGQFPNTYELRKYVVARLSAVISNYIDLKIEGEDQYKKYMNKKISHFGTDLSSLFRESEKFKFITILNKLENMLENEISYNEKQWQFEIIQIILLLYPKYIYVFKNVQIYDTYNQKKRFLDFMLVDSTGNTDIIEIKQPFDKCIVTNSLYRDNYLPLRELSGTVMQIEKYIFYLNKWGKKGEEYLTKKYEDILPEGFKIKVTNPSGIIIMGREKKLINSQRQDFEVIKRKYKNIIDIITYDDLLGRLRFSVEQFNKELK